MKPRTKLHIEVVGLTNRIPRIAPKHKVWAFNTTLLHKGFANKSRAFCLDCGENFPLELINRKKATCPHCNTKLAIEQTRKTTDRQVNYFAIAEIVEDFQVIRNFEIISDYKIGKRADYRVYEILQYWVHPEKKLTMFGMQHHVSYCMDSWGGPMEIREERRSWRGDKYDVYPRFYHPDSVFKKEYSKLGIDYNLKGINFLEAIKILPKYSKPETILKAKQYSILANYASNSSNVCRYWNSLKICFRNKYLVKDASMYFDYLDLLSYFKKDLHNAKYVCPKNLKKEHDILMKKKTEILRIQRLETERLKIIERQKNLEKSVIEYVERNKKFFELEFKEKNISIKVLQSIDEFLEEAEDLKHCVYTNEYYAKEKSLILSAKVAGKRMETIEIKLPELKIEQSRGLGNKPSKYHDKIVELVTKNLIHIRKIAIKTRPKSRQKAVA